MKAGIKNKRITGLYYQEEQETQAQRAGVWEWCLDMDIKLLAMDVDGVLTDGGIIVHGDGSESVRFHVRDGAWLRVWRRLGMRTAAITGRECPAVARRLEALETDFVYQGARRKAEVLEQLLAESQVPAEQIAYIGDEVMDLPVMRRVGFSASVADGLEMVREAADYVTDEAGGQGAVAELIRYMLKEMGLWDKAMERYR